MSFARRIKLFIIGIGLGILMAYMFFHDRELNWMPEDRVLMRLRANPLDLSDKIRCQLDCYQWTDEDIALMLEEGDVEFSESEPRRMPNPYYIVSYSRQDDTEIRITFEAIDTTSTKMVDVMDDSGKKCDC